MALRGTLFVFVVFVSLCVIIVNADNKNKNEGHPHKQQQLKDDEKRENELKAAEEKRAIEQKIVEEKRQNELKAAEEKRQIEQKAAAEKKKQEHQKVVAELEKLQRKLKLEEDAKTLPNIVIFLADDLGYADIGAFGNDTLRTPHVDNLARQGAKLTHHLAAAAICTPSRAALLTGRYPVRSGMASHDVLTAFGFVAAKAGLPPNETTFAELLKLKGYKNALIGKWHQGIDCGTFGDNCHNPLNQGFDYFFGVPLSNARDFGHDGDTVVFLIRPTFKRNFALTIILGILTAYILLKYKIIGMFQFFLLCLLVIALPSWAYWFLQNIKLWSSVLMRNYEYVEQPIDFTDMTKRLVNEGNMFIRERDQDKKPFMLFMSWLQVHTFLHTGDEFKGVSKHGEYGDNVEEMDWGIGAIMQTLEKYGMTDNTIVYFSSDNGGHLEEKDLNGRQAGGWNKPFRGGKSQGGYDGGIRMPTTLTWPKRIKAGTVISEPTSQMDILPTLANIAGVEVPRDRLIDGKDLMPLIDGKQVISSHEFMFHYCGVWLHAVRWRPQSGNAIYKVHYGTPKWLPGKEECEWACSCKYHTIWHDTPLLYNIADDLGELHELDTSTPENQKVLEIVAQAKQEHEDSVRSRPVPRQFEFMTAFWNHQLQPCGNYPYCSCRDHGSCKMEPLTFLKAITLPVTRKFPNIFGY
ncbi:unnamed protein product [Owenia fusiformis]|uniref:Uncharacterized protein n=1 Tax=Owenia fusiformis TaxID=6347 RepID=A0A8J1U3X0_OWEFU|nr:unnamed protein product [Owenia fusiformis]